MKSIGRYLKPYVFVILFALALLGMQAYTELSLPNLMSELVNVGIQQGGIEPGAPESLSEEAKLSLEYFMTDGEKASFDKAYGKQKDGTYKRLEPPEKSRDKDESAEEIDQIYWNASYSILEELRDMGQVNTKGRTGESSTKAENQPTIEDIPSDFFVKTSMVFSKFPKEKLMDRREKSLETEPMFKKQISSFMTRIVYKSMDKDMGQLQRDYIMKTGGRMILLTGLGALASILVGYILSIIGTTISMNFRKDIFKKVMSFSSKEYNSFSTSSLITRSTNDIQQIQMLSVMGARIVAYAPIMAIGGIFMALKMTRGLGWLIALAVIVVVGLLAVIMAIVMPKFKLLQKLTDRINLVARENLTGLMIIRAFNTQAREKEKFEEASGELRDVSRLVMTFMGGLMPTMMLIMNLTTIAILWFGADLISKSQMQVGDMMAFMQYAMQIIIAFLMITVIAVMIPRASVSIDRVNQILKTDVSIKNKPEDDRIRNEKPRGDIEFSNVSFGYDQAEAYVVEDLNFTAKAGETTAIIGSTGSGKSTIVQLIPRFFDVGKGSIKIDGIDIRDYDLKQLRDLIGFMPQKGFLFQGDFASNLRFGREDSSEEEMWKALEIAQAADFVKSKDRELEDPVAQSGANLSGGQKQRISIARALNKKAPIYIFDDTFSALDYKTDAKLRKALKTQLKDATILIVAQRINTIRFADKILVLEKGKIVGQGTHEQLMETCPTYREIANSQLSKEELDER